MKIVSPFIGLCSILACTLANAEMGEFEVFALEDITSSSSLEIVDLDLDQDLDLVINPEFGTPVYRLNDPTEEYYLTGPNLPIQNEFAANLLVTLDVNGDTYPDLVISSDGGEYAYFLNNGSSAPFEGVLPSSISNSSISATQLLANDINADGLADIIVVRYNQQSSELFLNQGTNPDYFVDSLDISDDEIYTFGIAIADTDLNGTLDLITTSAPGTSISDTLLAIHFNNGSSTPFSDKESLYVSGVGEVLGVDAADIDNDNDIDFVVATSSSTLPNHVLINQGLTKSSFEFDRILFSQEDEDDFSYLARFVDLNLDGFLDLVIVEQNMGATSDRLIIYENMKRSPFFSDENSKTILLPIGSDDIEIADISGNGWPDIAVASRFSVASLLFNEGVDADSSSGDGGGGAIDLQILLVLLVGVGLYFKRRKP